jgi:two-component system, cell cycle sensor histidine kinase and response regulator CckA
MSAQAAPTILVVEDEPILRRFVRLVLTQAGYTVLEAGNGAQALKHFRAQGGVDLVIMDLVMPGSGGLDIANELLTIRPEVKILYTTGYSNSVMSQCIATGAPAAMLPKPFSPDDLLARVKELAPWIAA